ncbi:hypothetical protein AOLI_G00054940 [Acnodon oligacanthus]
MLLFLLQQRYGAPSETFCPRQAQIISGVLQSLSEEQQRSSTKAEDGAPWRTAARRLAPVPRRGVSERHCEPPVAVVEALRAEFCGERRGGGRFVAAAAAAWSVWKDQKRRGDAQLRRNSHRLPALRPG